MTASTPDLRTFLFTDIEGSSLLWLDHRATMQEAVAAHDRVMRDVSARHGGEVFKTAGDAFFISFRRPSDAVLAACEAQVALAAQVWPPIGSLKVRAAIHVGTAEERGGDYFGPALNRCARLLGLAHGGQVLVTAAITELLASEREVRAPLRRLGYHPLDDPRQSVGVCQVVIDGLPQDFPPLRSAGSANEPLLAVLAFDNLSGDPELGYFSDGVSEEILDTIGRGSGLKVIARSSSFQFRGAEKAVKKVVADLKVTHLLDGSVRRSGSHVRIAARLVECGSETVIWSDSYDRNLTDIFVLQDEIAANVAAALEAAFQRSGRRPGKLDPAAHDLFLRARDDSAFRPRSERIEMLEQCVALAPGFADGWAWLACERADHAQWARGADLPLAPLVEAARTALVNAERLDPTMGRTREAREALEPHAAYRQREVLLREAIRLSPGDPLCLASTADLLGEVGRCREALALAEEAKALNPLPAGQGEPWAFARWLSLLDYDEQASQFDALLAKWPANSNFSLVSAAYAAANADWPRYESLRRHAYAQPFAEDAGVAAGMRQVFRYWDAIRDRDRAVLDGLTRRLLERVESTGTAPLNSLWSAGAAGYVDAAFQAVDRAAFDGAFELGGPRVSAWWQGALFQRCFSGALIDDPRFLRLCGKLGLVHYWLDIGRWPDCADQVRYDFRAEARKVAAEGLARHV